MDLDRLQGHAFEDLVERLLIKMGFSTEGRKGSADGGIDIVAVSHQPFFEGKYIIQCKRQAGSVSVPVVRDLFGVVHATHANKGILITTSSFTSEAVEFARDKPLELIDGARLRELLAQYELAELPPAERRQALRLSAMQVLRRELVGLADKYQRSLVEIDNEASALSGKGFGSERELRTYRAYVDFGGEIVKRLGRLVEGVLPAARQVNALFGEEPPRFETAQQAGRHFRALGEQFVQLYAEVKRRAPPSEQAEAHSILEKGVRQGVTEFLVLLRSLEETLERSKGTYELEYKPEGTWLHSFKVAWEAGHQKGLAKFRRW